VRRVALILAPWFVLVAGWYGIHYSGLINPALVPTPHAVFGRFVELAQSRLPLDMLMSTRRVFVGVLSGTLRSRWGSSSAGIRTSAALPIP
jgi:NitT/TauT family transport system permease protein